MDDADAETPRTAAIAACLNTICCDKISLTYKTLLRILKPRKSKFLLKNNMKVLNDIKQSFALDTTSVSTSRNIFAVLYNPPSGRFIAKN